VKFIELKQKETVLSRLLATVRLKNYPLFDCCGVWMFWTDTFNEYGWVVATSRSDDGDYINLSD